MYIVQCLFAMYNVYCTMFTMYNVHNVQCTQCIKNNVLCICIISIKINVVNWVGEGKTK